MLSASSGRWLSYSNDPSTDTIGGLSANFTQYSCTYGGACGAVPGTGNGFLYSIADSGSGGGGGSGGGVTVPSSVNQALSDYSEPEYEDSRVEEGGSGRLIIEVEAALLRMLGLSPDDPNRWWDKVVGQ